MTRPNAALSPDALQPCSVERPPWFDERHGTAGAREKRERLRSATAAR